MKKFSSLTILFAAFLLLAGCSSSGYEMEKTVLFSGYDFSKYYQKGFLFTPEQYLGDYESIGLLEVEILPDVRRATDSYQGAGWKRVASSENMNIYWDYSIVSTDEVLEAFYEKAKNMGADAVVRLKFDVKFYNNGEILYPSTSASGFAIKRKSD